jgi:hypothetical protein
LAHLDAGGAKVSLTNRWRSLWDTVRHSPARLPARVPITADHIDWGAEQAGEPFRPNEHYFQVRVNELFLQYDRQWFSTYDPMVLIVSEFTYDKKDEAVPFVVGPSLLQDRGVEVPAGMVFSDTRVAGLHPYRGGRLSLSVVLSRVQRQDYLKELLSVVENVAGALDFATALGSYVKIASAVLDGVESMFGLEGTSPLVGYRKEFDPDGGDVLAPGYFALVDAPEDEVAPETLWVRQHQLHHGPNLADAKPFRAADFVLYSLVQTPRRGDLRTLPFFELYERVERTALETSADGWKRAKADMASLWQSLILSPDLTDGQANELAATYRDKMVELHEQARQMAKLGPGEPAAGGAELAAAADVLDL